MKIKKKKQVEGKDIEVEEEEDAAVVTTAVETAAPSAAPDPAPAPSNIPANLQPKGNVAVDAAASTGAQAVVSVPTKEADHIRISIIRELDPAPKVGNYDFRIKHGFKKLAVGQTMLVPPHVAMHLKDAKAAIIAA